MFLSRLRAASDWWIRRGCKPLTQFSALVPSVGLCAYGVANGFSRQGFGADAAAWAQAGGAVAAIAGAAWISRIEGLRDRQRVRRVREEVARSTRYGVV